MKSQAPSERFIDPLPGIDQIPDPRNSYLVHYPLPEVLFLVVAASVSYCDKLTEMAVFGEEKIEWLRKYYPYKYGAPSHDTLGRMLSLIERHAFERWFIAWVAETFDLEANELINFDGKRLAGSADKMDQSKKKDEGGKYAKLVVNAFAAGSGMSWASAMCRANSARSRELSNYLRIYQSEDVASVAMPTSAAESSLSSSLINGGLPHGTKGQKPHFTPGYSS